MVNVEYNPQPLTNSWENCKKYVVINGNRWQKMSNMANEDTSVQNWAQEEEWRSTLMENGGVPLKAFLVEHITSKVDGTQVNG